MSLKIRNSELGTRNSELGARNSELGTRNSELGTRNSELGTRNPELGPRAGRNLRNQPVLLYKFFSELGPRAGRNSVLGPAGPSKLGCFGWFLFLAARTRN